MIYTLELDERLVQWLVDNLRRLPHADVDDDLRSIRAQCEAQDKAAAKRLRAELVAEVIANMKVDDAPDAVA